MSNSGKLELQGASRGCSSLKPRRFWLHSYTNYRTQSVISKAFRQSDLYHNPDPSDPLGQPVGEANESKIIVEGQETRALLDSGSQLLAISYTWVKKLKLEPKQLQSIL